MTNTCTTTARGLRALMASYVQSMRSSTLAGWLSTTTSATAVSRRSRSSPSGALKSSVTIRLLRPTIVHIVGRPAASAAAFMTRNSSPSGGSTFTTSAPQSASTAPADGEKPQLSTSSTRNPSSGIVMRARLAHARFRAPGAR